MKVTLNPYSAIQIASTKNFTKDNSYLCEVGTYLDMKTRVNQLKQSGQLMYQYKKAFAESQVLDDRLLDNDNDVDINDFDHIDMFNAQHDLADKLKNASENAPNPSESTQNVLDDKDIENTEKDAENASE